MREIFEPVGLGNADTCLRSSTLKKWKNNHFCIKSAAFLNGALFVDVFRGQSIVEWVSGECWQKII